MKLNGLSNWGVCINLAGMVVGVLVVLADIVRAQRSTEWSEGSLRLVGGLSENEGTVLIYHWSRWGAICDDYWDLRDAHVVCNELGYPGAKEASRRSRFGKGRRRVWLSGLHCRGNERHVTMCYSRGWGNIVPRCEGYWSSAGVVCNPKTSSTTSSTTTATTLPTTSATTTPTPTTTPSTTKQTTVTTQSTTTTTPSTTTTKPTTTTTPSTTTTTPSTTTPKPTTTTTPSTTATTPSTTTPKPTTTTTPLTTATTPSTTTSKTTTTKNITTKTIQTTTTPQLTTTPRPIITTPPRVYNQWIYNRELWRYFMYFRDGTFVTSRPDPRYFNQIRNTTTVNTTTTTTTTPRPRQDNRNPLHNTIGGENDNRISNSINPYEPQSIRQPTVNSIPRHEHRHRHHHNSNSIKEGYVHDQPMVDEDTNKDAGNVEDNVDDYDNFDESNRIAPTTTTTKKPRPPTYTEYRLVGGREVSGYREGRIEVRLAHSFTWGVICGDNWDIRAAVVTCKHFNAGYARLAQKTSYYGGSNMDKVIATLRCTGKEDRLEDCTVEKAEDTPGKLACSKAQSVAGVICETRLPDLEPDLKAIEESVFLRDRYLYYLQCAYEEKCLSTSANELYGTRTWAYATRRLLHFSTIAKNIGTADFRPDIDRSQWEWHACHQHYHSMESFSHYDIIDEHGNQVAEGHKASFCLEDSRCDRGIFPKYDCKGFGHQGISVGCQDSYLADIDCQWIDVTDVPPGLYTLKIELNPNMKVAEISYDNNVAKCTLYFNTRQAQVYNCKLDSLL